MSNVKEELIGSLQFSTHMLIAAAKAVPEDKRDVKHGEAGTSVTWQINHCAHFPAWVKNCVNALEADMTFGGEQPSLPFDEAISSLEAATQDFAGFILSVPDENLGKTITFPWATGTVKQVLAYQEWNNTYHMGQINYIQMLLGDTEMHM